MIDMVKRVLNNTMLKNNNKDFTKVGISMMFSVNSLEEEVEEVTSTLTWEEVDTIIIINNKKNSLRILMLLI